MHVVITSDRVDLRPGGEVLLRHQSWLDYEQLLEQRQDRATIKLYFDALTHEIRLMSPLPEHGKKSDTLSDLVKCLLRHQGKDWESFAPITLKRVPQQGAEPDACFYIQNRTAILGKPRIDLEVDPPPDLALEIDLTSLTKPEDYEAIAVPELWIYRDRTLSIYQFDGQHYQPTSTSGLFPNFPVQSRLPHYIERAWAVGSSVALREFEQELQSSSSL